VAILFVMLHELCHILRGHFRYIQQGPDQTHLEIGSIPLSPYAKDCDAFVRENFLKLAEFDADSHAVILYYSLSLELFAMLSSDYETRYPDWRTTPEQENHRNDANVVGLFGATIALTIIETMQLCDDAHQSPFARLIDLFDAYAQEVFKAAGHLDTDDPNKGLAYIPYNHRLKTLMSDHVLLHFLTSVDLVNETGHILGYKTRTGEDFDNYAQAILTDFTTLLKTVSPGHLKTVEAFEYNELRNYRPNFNALITSFIKL
jgi:hypothetical protein